MSDVVAVALISSGSSILGAAVGAIAAYKVNLRNAETAEKTAEAQEAVEMAKIKAENTRLRQQHDEEERRSRQSTYHRTVAVLQRIYGISWSSEASDEVWEEWRYCRSGVQIFGSQEAFKAVDKIQEVVAKKPADLKDHSSWDEDFKKVAYEFIDVVREDVRIDQQ